MHCNRKLFVWILLTLNKKICIVFSKFQSIDYTLIGYNDLSLVLLK